MPPSPALLMRVGRWLLPWIAVVLVSASVALAMTSALVNSRPPAQDHLQGANAAVATAESVDPSAGHPSDRCAVHAQTCLHDAQPTSTAESAH
jgi:hypothetical protein